MLTSLEKSSVYNVIRLLGILQHLEEVRLELDIQGAIVFEE